MPQYKKVFDIGTYTGNGGQYRVGIPTLRPPGPTGTQIAGSTRFRAASSTYLSRTFALGNRRTFTWSGWVKRGSSTGAAQWLFDADNGSTDSTEFNFGFGSSDTLSIGGSLTTWRITTQLFKDVGVWYHIVAAIDTTQATANNRIRIYVNGSEVTSFSTLNNPTQNLDLAVNQAITHYIGIRTGLTVPLDGYLSELYFVDGQQLTPSSFGEYNSDGIWVPKAYSGTYGTNGFYLPMNNSTNFKNDQSGNSNNWTPVAFNTTTANTSYDLMTDSPTDYLSGSMSTANNAGNYCTWSRSNSYIPSGSPGTPTFTNGNMEASIASSVLGFVDLRGTFVIPQQGKWYFEVYQYNNSAYINEVYVGICDQRKVASATPPYNSGDYGYLFTISNGNKRMNGTSSAYGSTPGNSTTICVAFDADNNKIWFGTNGTWAASGDPAAGTNEAGSTLSGLNYVPVASITAGNGEQYRHYIIANFGQRPFSYTVPSGFKSLNTYNLTKPSDSNLWFYGDTPDLMWIKNRSTTGLNVITDTVRGPGLNFPTLASVETSYPAVTEMNKFGMSIINDSTSIVNGSTNSHVYWAWKAGSNTSSTSVTNTNGATTSQVSANPSAGFSIVSFTTNLDGSTYLSTTVGHGLAAAPSMIIFKARNQAYSFGVYHQSIGNGSIVYLNSTNALNTATYHLNDTSPTSSVFTVGYGSATGSAADRIAYCWTAIPGYSSFGSYAGNGVADGPFVYTGFRPRWLMVKSITAASASNWCIYDVVRQTYNQLRNPLYANATTAEPSSGIAFDIVSNGFKLREGGGQGNDSGVTYIYAAFAEIPFKYARAR